MNQFGKEFKKLYEENQQHEFFIDHEIDLGDKTFAVVEFVPVNSILNNCYKIARVKARYTMDESQSLEIREPEKKVINQFKGIMAETAIHIYLHRRCNFSIEDIHRWDLERTTFTDAHNEYDLKISRNGVDYFIESRSSSSYRSGLDQFMLRYDIIGKYSNRRKSSEKVSDMYVRPVFQYVNRTLTKDEYELAVYDTCSDISDKNLKLFLVAVAGKDEMYGEHGYTKNMRQGYTKYQCIKIKDAHDIAAVPLIYYLAAREG